MIRVAQVVGKMNGGGVEHVVMNYYRHIDRSCVQFDFLVDDDSTLVPREEIESLGGRVFIVPSYQRQLAYQRELGRLLRGGSGRPVLPRGQAHRPRESALPLFLEGHRCFSELPLCCSAIGGLSNEHARQGDEQCFK